MTEAEWHLLMRSAREQATRTKRRQAVVAIGPIKVFGRYTGYHWAVVDSRMRGVLRAQRGQTLRARRGRA